MSKEFVGEFLKKIHNKNGSMHSRLKYPSVFDPVGKNYSLWSSLTIIRIHNNPHVLLSLWGSPKRLLLGPNSAFHQWWQSLTPWGGRKGRVLRFPYTGWCLPLCLFSLWLSITLGPRVESLSPDLFSQVFWTQTMALTAWHQVYQLRSTPGNQGGQCWGQTCKTSVWRMCWRD